MKTVLLSVKPEYATRIFEGSKRFEFRKTRFAHNVGTAFIYATAPVSRIVGYFRVTGTKSGSPSSLWRICRTASGIQRKDFFSYFRNVDKAYALIVGEVKEFKYSIDPRDLCPTLSIPQNYRYLDSTVTEKIITWRL